MSCVYCGIVLPATGRLLETEGCRFSKFTILGFLPSTADASVVAWHGSVLLGLGVSPPLLKVLVLLTFKSLPVM
jgi:hypothetical protein